MTLLTSFTNSLFLKLCIFHALFLSLFRCSYLNGVESFSPNARAVVHQWQASSRILGSGCSPVLFPRFLVEGAVTKPCYVSSGIVFSRFPIVQGLPPRLVQQHGSVLSSSSTTDNVGTTSWKEDVMDYLNNNYYSDLLVTMAMAFTEIGTIAARKNAFSGGSYKVLNATLSSYVEDGDDDTVHLNVYVQLRSEKIPSLTKVSFSLDADPTVSKYQPTIPKVIATTTATTTTSETIKMNLWIRRWNRLCWIVKQPSITGKLVQFISSYTNPIDQNNNFLLLLRDNLYLNQVPHNRYVRQYFYDLANNAIMEAIQRCSSTSNRMQMTLLFPELNPSMDAYRIGTLLELVRYTAIKIAEQNLRVRICVQGSMGSGIFTSLPKQLSGVATLLERMDWQSGVGEENDGIIGTYVKFGAIGKEHVVNTSVKEGVIGDDVFIILCPQNMVGTDTSVIPILQQMVEAAGDRPVILINPSLGDRASSGGQQSFRGRQERLDFCNSFQSIFHMECLYMSGTSYFPIVGALTKMSPSSPWVAYQRRDLVNNEGEVYIPVLCAELRPSSDMILSCFES